MVSITHYTDPSCPFAFSAEPCLRRLEWLYGGQLEWTTVLVVLSDDTSAMEAHGLTPEKLASGQRKLGQAHGMPIDWTPRERLAASRDACLDVVATRLHAPEKAEALLRALRVLGMGGGLLDGPALRAEAARLAEVDPSELETWRTAPEAETALDADRRAARTPSAAATALDHKLGGSRAERRYSCPSLELRRADAGDEPGLSVSLPGFQSIEAYEAGVASVAPEAVRRDDPRSSNEALEWASFPLASAEVAAVCGLEIDDARVELSASGANFQAVGADGYWSLG